MASTAYVHFIILQQQQSTWVRNASNTATKPFHYLQPKQAFSTLATLDLLKKKYI